MAGGILVITEIETDTQTPAPTALSLEMLGLARRVADEIGGGVTAVMLGAGIDGIDGIDGIGATLVAHGADTVLAGDNALFAPYTADAWLPDVAKIATDTAPAVILLAHSTIGWDLAPRLAFRLDTAVATGCEAVDVDNGKILMTRACYGGKAREQISFTTAPAIATVKSKTQEPLERDEGRSGDIAALESILSPGQVRVRLTGQNREKAEGVRLETAKIVVAGGGGLGGPDGFTVAKELADLLGGAVGASRVAVELGWCPHSWQVGLSGKTVAPDLYIAIGISGAGQHMAGCANSGMIVAINQDADAAIFQSAKYGVISGYEEIVPALIGEIKKIRA
jgi:electron transfer flavoprotein alpha subunit